MACFQLMAIRIYDGFCLSKTQISYEVENKLMYGIPFYGFVQNEFSHKKGISNALIVDKSFCFNWQASKWKKHFDKDKTRTFILDCLMPVDLLYAFLCQACEPRSM